MRSGCTIRSDSPLDLTREIAAENGLDVDRRGIPGCDGPAEGARPRRTARKDDIGLGPETSRRKASMNCRKPSLPAMRSWRTKGLSCFCTERTPKRKDSFQKPVPATRSGSPPTGHRSMPLPAAQVGDTGTLTGDGCTAVVTDTVKSGEGVFLHRVDVSEGILRMGDSVRMSVDRTRRLSVATQPQPPRICCTRPSGTFWANMSAQSGSSVGPDRLRFDFSHFRPLTEEERCSVEDAVNRTILDDLPVTTELLALDEARKRGATALFDEKYGEHVRVVRVGAYSMELCGGTHLHHSSQACLFRITSESGVAAGVRRIEAVTGAEALARASEDTRLLTRLADRMKIPASGLEHRVETLLEETSGAEQASSGNGKGRPVRQCGQPGLRCRESRCVRCGGGGSAGTRCRCAA